MRFSISRILLCSLLASAGTLTPYARGQAAPASPGTPASADDCTHLLQTQDPKSIEACKSQLDQAEAAPPTERMARLVANDEYGIALLAIAHQPKQSLNSFDREIAILPQSTVKPDSLQWAAAYWHRATAYQQLGQYESAAKDLTTAADTLQKAATAATGDAVKAEHFQDLRKRVLTQHAAMLEQQGKHAEAQKLLSPATQ
jgi:tetratricopeptide (TPR) repeat protein